ncbi:MAG: maleylpyruvate isomerase N-terminal domain-containing protein [Candidatus Dormiibacterota bacterium]
MATAPLGSEPDASARERLLLAIEASTARLTATIATLNAGALAGPSRLGGWDRRTIVAHLAYVATAYVRVTADVLAGRPASSYPGGSAERARSLHSLDGCSPADSAERFRTAADELRDRWARLEPPQWERRFVEGRIGAMALARLIPLRLTELEVHGSDLDAGLEIAGWSDALVSICLPLRVAWLPVHHRDRPDAALTCDGSWLLRATDTGARWLVQARGPDAWCRVAGARDDAEGEIAGPARSLLAYLLGRMPPDPPAAVGGEVALVRFKRAFPGP